MVDPSPHQQPHCEDDAGVVRQPQRIRQCREGFWRDRLDEPTPVGVRKRTERQGRRDKLPGTTIGTRRTNSYQAQQRGSPVGKVLPDPIDPPRVVVVAIERGQRCPQIRCDDHQQGELQSSAPPLARPPHFRIGWHGSYEPGSQPKLADPLWQIHTSSPKQPTNSASNKSCVPTSRAYPRLSCVNAPVCRPGCRPGSRQQQGSMLAGAIAGYRSLVSCRGIST